MTQDRIKVPSHGAHSMWKNQNVKKQIDPALREQKHQDFHDIMGDIHRRLDMMSDSQSTVEEYKPAAVALATKVAKLADAFKYIDPTDENFREDIPVANREKYRDGMVNELIKIARSMATAIKENNNDAIQDEVTNLRGSMESLKNSVVSNLGKSNMNMKNLLIRFKNLEAQTHNVEHQLEDLKELVDEHEEKNKELSDTLEKVKSVSTTLTHVKNALMYVATLIGAIVAIIYTIKD